HRIGGMSTHFGLKAADCLLYSSICNYGRTRLLERVKTFQNQGEDQHLSRFTIEPSVERALSQGFPDNPHHIAGDRPMRDCTPQSQGFNRLSPQWGKKMLFRPFAICTKKIPDTLDQSMSRNESCMTVRSDDHVSHLAQRTILIERPRVLG